VVIVETLAGRLAVLKPHLNERPWRLLLGVEAEAIGRGGISLVARLSGAPRTTVQSAVAEIRAGAVPIRRVSSFRAPSVPSPSTATLSAPRRSAEFRRRTGG
jgi:hypothetical protein